jgi:hypothetical protein
MYAVTQASSFELVSKIAHLAVLFRNEFYFSSKLEALAKI